MPFLPAAHYARPITDGQKRRLIAIAYATGYDMPALKRMLSHFDCELDEIPATRYNEIIQEAESKEAADYWYEETCYDYPDIWELNYF